MGPDDQATARGPDDAPPVAPRPRAVGRDDGRRDRNPDGRPEQARPRDRSGRPLPYAAVTDDVELAELFEPATLGEALDLGTWLWDRQRFFECHEALEHVWHAAPEQDRDFWQGVIQVAVAGVHHQRGNLAGFVPMLRKAAGRLDRHRPTHRGVDVALLADWCIATADRAAARGTLPEVLDVPPFPAVAGEEHLRPDERATPVDG